MQLTRGVRVFRGMANVHLADTWPGSTSTIYNIYIDLLVKFLRTYLH
jgi:hypothetical protein